MAFSQYLNFSSLQLKKLIRTSESTFISQIWMCFKNLTNLEFGNLEASNSWVALHCWHDAIFGLLANMFGSETWVGNKNVNGPISVGQN